MAQPNLKDIFPFTDTSEEEFLLTNDEVSNENWNVSDNYRFFRLDFIFTAWAGTGPQPTIHNIKHKI